jgi:hypothetical protein
MATAGRIWFEHESVCGLKWCRSDFEVGREEGKVTVALVW